MEKNNRLYDATRSGKMPVGDMKTARKKGNAEVFKNAFKKPSAKTEGGN
jgi:hypothetical protein